MSAKSPVAVVGRFEPEGARDRRGPEPAASHIDRITKAPSDAAPSQGGITAWEWDVRADRMTLSDSFRSFTGMGPSEPITLAQAMATVAEEDRARTMESMRRVRDGESAVGFAEYRVRGDDGNCIWLASRSEPVHDETGAVVRITGIALDVTSRRGGLSDLRSDERLWQAAMDSLTARVAVVDASGAVIAVNDAWRDAARAGEPSAYLRGESFVERRRAEGGRCAEEIVEGVRAVLSGERDLFVLEYPEAPSQESRWSLVRATPCLLAGVRHAVISHQDVTELRASRDQVYLKTTLLDAVDVAVIASDLDRRIVGWSAGATRLYGWSEQEVLGANAQQLLVCDDAPLPPNLPSLATEAVWEGELVVRRKDGTSLPTYLRRRRLFDRDGVEIGTVGVSMDISEQRRAAEALRDARDDLRAVTDSMGEGMFTLDREGRVTYMNDAARRQLGWEPDGRHVYPLVWSVMSRRDVSGAPVSPLLRAQEAGEVVRVEDDEFRCADRGWLPVAYTAAPLRTEDGARGCVVVFEDATARRAEQRRVQADLAKLRWVKRIRAGLDEERFVLHGQPIVDLADERVVSHELLLRLQGADSGGPDGLIAPGSFMPVAEEYGFIAEIDRWVIDRSFEVAATGRPVELNVSAKSIGDPALIEHFVAAIERTGADPSSVVVELTETALLDNATAGARFVRQLHTLGCRVALDDFGTGYGGFTYLKRLPVDYLKIDIEFVRDLSQNAASQSVVQAIAQLARDFGSKTIAEGVESPDAIDLLREFGIDYGQGYLFGRPAPLPAT